MNDLDRRQEKAKNDKTIARILTDTIQAMVDGVLVFDLEGTCIFANPQYAETFGLEQQDFLGRQIMDIRGIEKQRPEEITKFMQLFKKAIETGRAGPADIVIVASDGHEISVNAAGATIKDAQGNPTHVIAVVRDITERKKMEEELMKHRSRLEELVEERTAELKKRNEQLQEEINEREHMEESLKENEARYRELADSIGDIFFAMDKELKYTYWNRASEELTGIAAKDAIGKSLYDIFPDNPQTRKAERTYMDVLRNQQPQTFVNEYHLAGKDFFFEISAYPSVDGISVFVKDITERKKAEEMLKEYSEKLEKMVEKRTGELEEAQEELIRKEKLATLGQISSSVGHELRNPLGTIANSTYYLNTRLKDADDLVKKHLSIIDRNIQRANRIVTELMDFSRTRAPLLAESSINDLIYSILTDTEIPRNITVETEFDEELPKILLDRDQIRQAFSNIIANAVEAMPEGGKLQIKTVAGPDLISVIFRDTGEGISEENLQKIFEPLFTTKPKGTGLGLSIVRNIVRGHRGRVEIESEIGKGATVAIELPLQQRSGRS